MKKILTILLVAVLAASTLFAVDFSGRFRAGYTFTFDGDYQAKPWKDLEAKITMKISDDNGIWTINVKNLGVATLKGDDVKYDDGKMSAPISLTSLDSDDKFGANFSLDLTKLLAANGVEVGEWSVKGSIGSNGAMTALSAYKDETGDKVYRVKNNGNYSAELAVGYGKVIETKVQLDPRTDKSKGASILVSAKSEPVAGASISALYGYNAKIGFKGEEADKTVKHAIGGAADIDIAELANLDFKLGLSVYDNFGIDKAGNKNSLAAIVYGGVDVVDGFFEFRMDNELAEESTQLGMKTQVNLNVVEGLGLDVYFNMTDFSTPEAFAVGGDVSYKVSGVEFAGNLEYDNAKTSFSITPKVIVVF